MTTKQKPKSLLVMLAELESRLEVIEIRMKQCIDGQMRIKGML